MLTMVTEEYTRRFSSPDRVNLSDSGSLLEFNEYTILRQKVTMVDIE